MTKRILVIDDEPDIRKVIQISLEAAAGWQVMTATSGAEGLGIAAQEKFDAVLLDVMMPELDGLATFKRLKANQSTQHMPIILLTAKTNRQEHQQFMQLGVTGVITKPFRARQLVAQIRTILSWDA